MLKNVRRVPIGKTTQKARNHFRKNNYLVATVEHWNSFVKIRQDLFGFADLLVIDPFKQRTIAVQVTSRSNVSTRKRKICDYDPEDKKNVSYNAYCWIKSGNEILVQGWDKKKKRCKDGSWSKREYWRKKDLWIKESDFGEEVRQSYREADKTVKI